MNKTLWARIGMSCEVTEEEYNNLKQLMLNNQNEAANKLDELFKNRGLFDGDSYLVADCDDNPNLDDDFDF